VSSFACSQRMAASGVTTSAIAPGTSGMYICPAWGRVNVTAIGFTARIAPRKGSASIRPSSLRARQQRNFLATLLLSQGVPMLPGGDEFGRSQGGNNNAWCQDSEISWFDWSGADEDLRTFTRRLIELRVSEPVFRRRDFLRGDEVVGSEMPDVVWFGCNGEPSRTPTGSAKTRTPSASSSTARRSPTTTVTATR
jgi:pullulanase/glycogen debranching enzyme